MSTTATVGMPRLTGRNHCCGFKWFNRDACGLVCVTMTWFLLGYAQFCIFAVMMSSYEAYPFHQAANFVVFQTLWWLALTAHIKTAFTDPGTVPLHSLDDDRQALLLEQGGPAYIIKCTKCSCLRPERAHHCSVCGRCVRRMDHHCPWVNNCVGEGNQKYFILFTMYICLVSLHALYWTVWQFLLCIEDNWQTCSAFSPPATAVIIIFFLFESILFSIFTMVMFGTQISSIRSDQTGIESLKHEKGHSTAGWKNLQVVCGGPCSLSWLSPLATPFLTERAFEFAV